jgi:carbamate kinase
VDAVVDKDRAAALVAGEIDADTLLILTDVGGVYRGFGTPAAEVIRRIDLAGARALLESAELGRGSMRPKVEAAVQFLRQGGRRVLIARLDQGLQALEGEAGTEIVTKSEP